ncbi:hypothetical protein BDV98DRAFT_588323 [Pterulicium gracile]|uniref:Uncharacterized protein n=1 Tax=Pterulicium gracile TaxID=1884261 RepID=A0A5C3R0Z1_9AGAR|nr:hypothetical protein BDV98DRAFT_588323 [Pterula gracilis]
MRDPPQDYDPGPELALLDNEAFYNTRLGPWLSGLVAQTFMMGVLTFQCYLYWETMASKDLKRNRWLVLFMFLTGIFQSGTGFELLYDTFICPATTDFPIPQFGWTFAYQSGWTALIAMVAQIFFLHRCFSITRSRALVVLCGVGILLSFSAGVATSVGLFRTQYFTRSNTPLPAVIVWLTATALTDVTISAVLMLSRLIKLAFETAGLTTLVAICHLFTLLFAMYNRAVAHVFFHFIIAKMYSHSVMVTLLDRRKITGLNEDHSTVDMTSHSLEFGANTEPTIPTRRYSSSTQKSTFLASALRSPGDAALAKSAKIVRYDRPRRGSGVTATPSCSDVSLDVYEVGRGSAGFVVDEDEEGGVGWKIARRNGSVV